MWQQHYEELKSEGFTIVGIAMDAEGVGPAKRYYEKHGVTFPALIDPNFASGFGYVPWTLFIDEHGVVRQKGGDWEKRIKTTAELKPVTPEVLAQWSEPHSLLSAEAIRNLEQNQRDSPEDLVLANDLANRYLILGRDAEATTLLQSVASHHDARQVALESRPEVRQQLSRLFLQLSRAEQGDRQARLEAARTAYFLAPTVGLAKQISRIADPTKFDFRPDGKLDNPYRNRYAKQIKQDREAWLRAEGKRPTDGF